MTFDFEARVRSLSKQERDEIRRAMWEDDDAMAKRIELLIDPDSGELVIAAHDAFADGITSTWEKRTSETEYVWTITLRIPRKSAEEKQD